MDYFLYDISLQAVNRVRRTLGSKWIDPGRFGMETPDRELNEAFISLENEIERRLSAPFGLRLLRNRWLQSSKSAGTASATESAFAARFIALFDPDLALEILRPFFNNQSPEGIVPLTVDSISASRLPSTHYLVETVLLLAGSSDIPDLPELFEKMQKFADWLLLYKKDQDGLYIHGDMKWSATDPFQYQLREILPDYSRSIFDMRSVSLNSSIACMFHSLSRLAKSLNKDRDAGRYEEMAVQLGDNVTKLLWDEEAGFYYDRIGDQPRRSLTLAGFMTLAAEIPTKAQAARMLTRLPDAREMLKLVKYSSSLAPVFDTVIEGLINYGYARDAAALAMDCVRFTLSLDNIPKYFLSRVISMLLLIEKIVGYNRFRDRYVVFPKIPDVWADGMLRIRNTRTMHNFHLTLRKEGKVDCRIISPGGLALDTRLENYTFRNIPLPIGGPRGTAREHEQPGAGA